MEVEGSPNNLEPSHGGEIDPAALEAAERSTARRFSSDLLSYPFVKELYRICALRKAREMTRLQSPDIPPAKGVEFIYRRKDGTTFPVSIEERVLKDMTGRAVGLRGTIQDITDRKKAEQELVLLQERLRQAQKMEAIVQLAGGVAHDFNNILTVINGRSEIALFKLREGDPLKTNTEEIKKASERAASLTQQLLAFSRRQILEFKVLDLNAILADLNRMLRRVIGEDIELVTLLGENLGRVKTDPGQIEQVIVNLAVNARDAMPNGGKIRRRRREKGRDWGCRRSMGL